MAQLRLYGRAVPTVFHLLGIKEDDITYSLGWGLGASEALALSLMCEFCDGDPGQLTAINLQKSVTGAGRTDIELESDKVHLIIEAKRGWELENEEKLRTYTTRFANDQSREHVLAVVAAASPEFAAPRLPPVVDGIPVRYASWTRIAQLVAQTAAESSSHAEKRLLRELHSYLKGVMDVRDIDSNLVYVVSLGTNALTADGTSFADFVTEHHSYFHPLGGDRKGWPKEPPNYLGFRYHGQLQEIRHVDSYEVHDEPWNAMIPGFGEELDWPPEAHFWYQLGPSIVPPRTVKNGPSIKQAARVWAAIDLLLTCETITEARDKTQARQEEAGA